MKTASLSSQSPFVYFWLGILTGALLVIASMMIRSAAMNGAASLLDTSSYSLISPQTRTTTTDSSLISPQTRTTTTDSSLISPQTLTR